MIQPDLVPPKYVAHASADNVTEAARAIIVRCVLRRRIGGVAMNIGTLPLEYFCRIERQGLASHCVMNAASQTDLHLRRRQ